MSKTRILIWTILLGLSILFYFNSESVIRLVYKCRNFNVPEYCYWIFEKGYWEEPKFVQPPGLAPMY
jgi:hypothetical protein